MKLKYDLWQDAYKTGKTPWRTKGGFQEWIKLSGISTGSALDLGCGTGEQAIWLAEQGFNVEAVDYSTAALEIARQAAATRSNLNIQFIEHDLENIAEYQFQKPVYDLIVCKKVLAFLENQDQFLKVISEKLAGVMILEVFLVHDEAQFIVSDEAKLNAQLKKYFTIDKQVPVATRDGVVIVDFYLTPKAK